MEHLLQYVSVYFSNLFNTYNNGHVIQNRYIGTSLALPLRPNSLYFLSLIWSLWELYIKLCRCLGLFSILRYFRFDRNYFCLNIYSLKRTKMAHLNLFVVLVASLVCFTLAEEKYTTKFDNFDVDKVLNNDRILTSYIKCLLDQGNCTNEGRELKSKS